MAECARRRSKKKKKNASSDQKTAGSISPDTETLEFSDKKILKFLIAAQYEDVETVRMYLESGMPVDTECLMFSESALIKTCRTGSVEAGRLLLDWGANITIRTDDGDSALHVAVRNKQPEMIKLLLSHGADLNAKTNKGELTPLMLAASMSKTDTLGLLIDAGCDLDLQDAGGMSALHHCFNYYQERVLFVIHSVDCARLLVEAGADVWVKDSAGRFPLTRAIEKCNIRGVKYLLAHNLDPNHQFLQRGARLTPLAFAASLGNHRLANLLWEAGARCDGVSAGNAQEVPCINNCSSFKASSVFAFSQPRSLRGACMVSVRDRLRACGGVGPQFSEKVDELCIPTSLKDFLRLRHLLHDK